MPVSSVVAAVSTNAHGRACGAERCDGGERAHAVGDEYRNAAPTRRRPVQYGGHDTHPQPRVVVTRSARRAGSPSGSAARRHRTCTRCSPVTIAAGHAWQSSNGAIWTHGGGRRHACSSSSWPRCALNSPKHAAHGLEMGLPSGCRESHFEPTLSSHTDHTVSHILHAHSTPS